MYQFSIPVADETEYFPSQYISDLVRKHGFDGIRYKSMNSMGNCYTIFNCCEENIKFCSSEIVLAQAPKYSIYSLNRSKIIEPPVDFEQHYFLSADKLENIQDYLFRHIEGKKKHGTHEI